jgi:hypothetical protein
MDRLAAQVVLVALNPFPDDLALQGKVAAQRTQFGLHAQRPGHLPEGVPRRFQQVQVPAAHAEITVLKVVRHRRAVQLFRHVANFPGVLVEQFLQDLHPRLVRFGNETRKRPLGNPAQRSRHRRLVLLDAQYVGYVVPFFQRHAGGQDA